MTPQKVVHTKHRYPTWYSLQQKAKNKINGIIDNETGNATEYRHLIQSDKYKETWKRSFANELGCLAQGVGNQVDETNTIFFVNYDEIPKDRVKDVTYG